MSSPAAAAATFDGCLGSRVGLVGCVKTKLTAAAPARDLFCSPLFRGRRRWVEATCSTWMIISARHGLVHPDQTLEPYDQTLTTAGAQERRNWAARVLGDLEELAGRFTGVYEVHAGTAYRDYGLTAGLVAAGAHVVVPAAGLSQGGQLALHSIGPGSGPRLA